MLMVWKWLAKRHERRSSIDAKFSESLRLSSQRICLREPGGLGGAGLEVMSILVRGVGMEVNPRSRVRQVARTKEGAFLYVALCPIARDQCLNVTLIHHFWHF
jgi:hypothetical protein